jgi:hypothetical protein
VSDTQEVWDDMDVCAAGYLLPTASYAPCSFCGATFGQACKIWDELSPKEIEHNIAEAKANRTQSLPARLTQNHR